MYQARHPFRSTYVTLRHQRYHVRLWGHPRSGQAPLVMLHGWMDVSASFQFVVDALKQERFVIAPDWRGFGLTREVGMDDAHPGHYGHADHYVFADYLADLDFLLDHFNHDLGRGDAAFDLLGHSMGGNVATMYAGVRPTRVRRLINLEGFGLPATQAEQAPTRYAQWIDELKRLHQGELQLQNYDSVDGVAQRLMKTNRRLSQERANWLAEHWAACNAHGHWEILGDPAHKIISAQMYRADEAAALLAQISAPTLVVEADDDSLARWYSQGQYTRAQFHDRLRQVRDCRVATVTQAGHMLHHDQPEQVAQLIESHLA